MSYSEFVNYKIKGLEERLAWLRVEIERLKITHAKMQDLIAKDKREIPTWRLFEIADEMKRTIEDAEYQITITRNQISISRNISHDARAA